MRTTLINRTTLGALNNDNMLILFVAIIACPYNSVVNRSNKLTNSINYLLCFSPDISHDSNRTIR